ncbi:MAG: InlB B-repeat-containing protein, partial [Clostridia bacterium]|nr:InlB B-repeat-containing protein [Clostridia bacterium]
LNSGVTISYCWLRSSISSYGSNALRVYSLGETTTSLVDASNGVRPAAHLSLSSIASFAKLEINFNSNGGSSCASIKVSPHTAYGTLPTPTRAGYSFVGWYKNSDLSGSAVTTSDIVTTDHTLYAKWTLANYTITLNQQGGSGGTSSVTATYTQTMPTATAPTRIANIFGGYYTGTNGSGTQYYDENMASVRNCDLTANTTLYAKWIWVGVNVHFAGSSTSASNIVFNDETNASVNIQPQTGHYVSEISFDNSTFYKIDSYSSYYVVDFALEFQCLASTSTNQIAFVINFIFFDYYDTHETINIYLKTTTTPYTELNKPSGGASIDGVAVSSTIGGSAEVLGDNYDSLEVGDTITVVARLKLIGYQFDGWYVDDTLLSANMSVRLTFDDTIKGKVLVAKFSEIENSNINNSTSN